MAAVEIAWSPLALARLQEIRAYIAQDKPSAAERIGIRIVLLVEALRSHPNLGHTGGDERVRELVVGGTPYIILYRAKAKRVIILSVRHAARADCDGASSKCGTKR